MGIMFYVWLMIMISAIVVEIATTDLTSFWFSIGSFFALILNLFVRDSYIWLQILVFYRYEAYYDCCGIGSGSGPAVRLLQYRYSGRPRGLDSILLRFGSHPADDCNDLHRGSGYRVRSCSGARSRHQ